MNETRTADEASTMVCHHAIFSPPERPAPTLHCTGSIYPHPIGIKLREGDKRMLHLTS